MEKAANLCLFLKADEEKPYVERKVFMLDTKTLFPPEGWCPWGATAERGVLYVQLGARLWSECCVADGTQLNSF